jgi:hypothetical protein
MAFTRMPIRRMTFGRITFSRMTVSRMTVSRMTVSRMTFCRMTFRRILFGNINVTQFNKRGKSNTRKIRNKFSRKENIRNRDGRIGHIFEFPINI